MKKLKTKIKDIYREPCDFSGMSASCFNADWTIRKLTKYFRELEGKKLTFHEKWLWWTDSFEILLIGLLRVPLILLGYVLLGWLLLKGLIWWLTG